MKSASNLKEILETISKLPPDEQLKLSDEIRKKALKEKRKKIANSINEPDEKYHTPGLKLPVFIEKDEDGLYVIECPLFEGCYTQGSTIDEALFNIREVIKMILDEKVNQEILKSYRPAEISFHTITL
jgi:predicted RNase H-like HicB family nuclease